MNATAIETAQMTLNMANEQLNLGWEEIDMDEFGQEDENRVAARLKMVEKLARQVERQLAK